MMQKVMTKKDEFTRHFPSLPEAEVEFWLDDENLTSALAKAAKAVQAEKEKCKEAVTDSLRKSTDQLKPLALGQKNGGGIPRNSAQFRGNAFSHEAF